MSAEPNVLYDAPGPKAKLRAHVVSVVVLLALGAIVYVAASRLAAQGQFAQEKWAPLFDPRHEYFQQVWRILGQGLLATLKAAALAIACSLVIGTLLGVLRLMTKPLARVPLAGLMELMRGLPVIITIFIASRILPAVGLDLSGMPGGGDLWYIVIGLTLYNSVIFAEILRAGVAALPRGQQEAGLAIGLLPRQVMFLVELPQAVRIMLPALISQIVVVVKDTSLAAVLGLYPELLYAAKQIGMVLHNLLQTLLVVAVIYYLINAALTWLAQWTDRRMSSRHA